MRGTITLLFAFTSTTKPRMRPCPHEVQLLSVITSIILRSRVLNVPLQHLSLEFPHYATIACWLEGRIGVNCLRVCLTVGNWYKFRSSNLTANVQARSSPRRRDPAMTLVLFSTGKLLKSWHHSEWDEFVAREIFYRGNFTRTEYCPRADVSVFVCNFPIDLPAPLGARGQKLHLVNCRISHSGRSRTSCSGNYCCRRSSLDN